jgi:hypothetical protein
MEVIVVVHHAVGVTEPIIAFIDMLERVQEVDAVLSSLKTAFFSLPREVMW